MSALPQRNEIAREETWDLTHLFPDEQAYQSAFDSLIHKMTDFSTRYTAQINSARNSEFLLEALKNYEAIMIEADACGTYVFLASSVDYSDQAAMGRLLKFQADYAQASAALSFFENEWKQVDPGILSALGEKAPKYQPYIRNLLDDIAHTLSAESEKLLSEFQALFHAAENTYQQSKLADLQFSSFSAAAQTHELSFVLYENHYCHERDTAIRRQAFQQFSQDLSRYRNTIASLYFSHIQSEKTLARLRGFDSVTDYLLHGQRVTADLYHRQIDLIMRDLSPHMQRYAKLLQRFHKLENMHYADLKLSLDPDYSPKIDIPQAKQLVLDALSVLGPDYQKIIERAFHERRLDWAQNSGKSTGGFCSSPYGKGGYILLNWGGELSEVFTLVHELGHLAHFTLAQAQQSPLLAECSWYLVEAPSTCNEVLLTQHLLKQKANDKRFRRWVLSSMVSNTYYHNFVTHLLEAAYQREVYQRLDAGEVLQADDFSSIFRKQLKSFWGDTVILDEGSELTWMRQPHYYNGLYPYTYSAGLTIATVLGQRIAHEGKTAVDDWLNVLQAGGSLRPLDFAKRAGVDIDTDHALATCISYIGSLIDEMERLSIEIGDC